MLYTIDARQLAACVKLLGVGEVGRLLRISRFLMPKIDPTRHDVLKEMPSALTTATKKWTPRAHCHASRVSNIEIYLLLTRHTIILLRFCIRFRSIIMIWFISVCLCNAHHIRQRDAVEGLNACNESLSCKSMKRSPSVVGIAQIVRKCTLPSQ